MATHRAAVLLAKTKPFELRTRPTPKPGPGELLIAVKAIALNPADGYMRDLEFIPIPTLPTVIGFDLAGLVLEVGENVPVEPSSDDNATSPGPFFRPGLTRVAAYSAFYFRGCNPDYGAFQERCLVPWQHAVPLPDDPKLTWNLAATLPVCFQVPLEAWDDLGIPRLGEASGAVSSGTSTDLSGKKPTMAAHKNEALLIWGASSSTGTGGVQTARLLREDKGSAFAAVYATAGAANADYIASLGADRVFDYKDPGVVEAIVAAAKEDGLVIRYCLLGMGSLSSCQAVLKAFLGNENGNANKTAKIGSAPPLPQDREEVDGVEVLFLQSASDDETRLAQFRYWMGTWLRKQLAAGTVKASPEPTVVGKGLEAVNAGLDKLARGVSCTKLVIEVAE